MPTPEQVEFILGLNDEHSAQIGWAECLYDSALHLPSAAHPLTKMFHERFGFSVNVRPVLSPSVSDRERRLRLIFEEFIELCNAMGFEIELTPGETAEGGETITNDLVLVHTEGSRYDPVETADALGDLNVVVNGTAIEFGIPIDQVNQEIFLSNMSKLGADGKTILNRCVEATCDYTNCNIPEHLIDPSAPVGKGLKGPNYIKPNIAKLIYRALGDSDNGE